MDLRSAGDSLGDRAGSGEMLTGESGTALHDKNKSGGRGKGVSCAMDPSSPAHSRHAKESRKSEGSRAAHELERDQG